LNASWNKKDITYFGKSYHLANLQVDISGLDQNQAARKVKEALGKQNETVLQNTKLHMRSD
jgi:hypothetical protein